LMESFHNDMTMMVQMFIAMHREFQSSVRDELQRVQKLTKELGRLNARLLQVSDSAEPRQTPDAVRPGEKGRVAARESRPSPGPTPPQRAVPRADRPAGPKPPGRGGEPDLAARPATSPGGREGDQGGQSPPRESAEMYADITRRITELQRQRRGYWQRILKAI